MCIDGINILHVGGGWFVGNLPPRPRMKEELLDALRRAPSNLHKPSDGVSSTCSAVLCHECLDLRLVM